MLAHRLHLFSTSLLLAASVGCATPSRIWTSSQPAVAPVNQTSDVESSIDTLIDSSIQPVVFAEDIPSVSGVPVAGQVLTPPPAAAALVPLEQLASQQNPRLQRLYHEYQAALSRSEYVDKLPDPRIGANVFGNPIQTASGSQRAAMTFSQAIPWLSRLSADEQRATLEAYAVYAELEAERLRVLAAVRTGWYRLYVIDKQIEIALANQQLLQSLIDVANARVATGAASQGDVLLGILELSQLEERLLTYRRQRQGVEAELNRLVARNPEYPIASADHLDAALPSLGVEQIFQVALEVQPELEAARLRTQATRWGVEVARLQRRPEFMISANYFPTDNNRPPSTVVDVGQDPWALGAQMSIPIWRNKYDAIENEARWKHQAAHNSVEELSDRYQSMIVDLLSEALRAEETAALYESTILPQARQTLSADQESYTNGGVEFDRVVRDYRNLLTLELGYHQAIGDLASAVARLRQAAGYDFPLTNLKLAR